MNEILVKKKRTEKKDKYVKSRKYYRKKAVQDNTNVFSHEKKNIRILCYLEKIVVLSLNDFDFQFLRTTEKKLKLYIN